MATENEIFFSIERNCFDRHDIIIDEKSALSHQLNELLYLLSQNEQRELLSINFQSIISAVRE